MKTKKITLKKLYNGYASIRDYIIKECIQQEKEICVHYKNWKMTLTIKDLENCFQFHNQTFKSKWGTNSYQLYDFKFIPNNLK